MANDNLAHLKRFRRVAMTHDIPLPETRMLADREIEHIREQLNASVFLEAEPWMLPSWVDLTLKGIDKDETLITSLPNNSYRNWSLVGGVGSKRYGITDSRGLVSAIPGCGSIDIWVQDTENIIFPALLGKDGPQLNLVSTEDQLYEWKTDVQSVEFVRLLYHVEEEDIEFLHNEVILKNIALEKTTITFYVALRPMSVIGFEPIEHLEFNPNTNQLFANDALALYSNTAPSAVYLVKADDATIPELIKSGEISQNYKESFKAGLGTAILRFEVTLSPAGTKTVILGSPLETLSDRNSYAELKSKSLNRDQSIGNWYDFTNKRGDAIFPDEELSNVLSQATVSLAIQSHSVLFPKASDDDSLNWRERMRLLIALVKSGGIDVTSQITNHAAEMFDEPDISMDTTIFSPLLWGLLQLQGYSIQRESIQENIDYLVKLAKGLVAALAIDRPKKKSVEGSSDDEIEDAPLEHYSVLSSGMLNEFNELLWDLKALQEGLSYFALTEVSLIDKIKETIPIAEKRVQEKLDEIKTARWPRSNDPQMVEIDRAILDILTSISQLRINGLDKKFLRELCRKASERRLVRNLWKVQDPKELFSSHLALRIAQFHVWAKQRDAAEPLLRRALEFMSQDFQLPDFVNPRTFGGSYGSGSSVMAAADIILLLTDMLVHEENENLVFLAGIPGEWFTSKKPLTVKGIHTRFGKTRIDIGLSANQHQIETGMEILPQEIEIHVPESVPIRMVKAYGGSIIDRALKDQSPHIKLVPLSNNVVLTYHR